MTVLRAPKKPVRAYGNHRQGRYYTLLEEHTCGPPLPSSRFRADSLPVTALVGPWLSSSLASNQYFPKFHLLLRDLVLRSPHGRHLHSPHPRPKSLLHLAIPCIHPEAEYSHYRYPAHTCRRTAARLGPNRIGGYHVRRASQECYVRARLVWQEVVTEQRYRLHEKLGLPRWMRI